jgi:hypothetical protein
MPLPIREFKILLYGPDIPPGGVKARAHFEDSMLVVRRKSHRYTVQCDRLNLETGGFDGKQWMLTWLSSSGLVTAMLQGEEAVKAIIKLAPPALSKDLRRTHHAHADRGRGLGVIFKAMLVIMVTLLLIFVAFRIYLGAQSG